MTDGAEYWQTKKQHMHKMNIAEMRILRWMCGKIMKDRARNECFQEHLWVRTIGDKIKGTYLRLFGHVQCRPVMAPVKKSLAIKVDDPPKERGKPKRK